jgi:glutamate-ammonia-ligase adenylyltransferase
MQQTDIELIPETFREQLLADWQYFADSFDEPGLSELKQLADQQPGFWPDLARVWVGSRFVVESCLRDPGLLPDLVHSGDLYRVYPEDHYANELGRRVDAIADEDELLKVLRHHRRREMVRLVWRDFARMADTAETTRTVSLLAEASIEQAMQWFYRHIAQRYGFPVSASGERQHMLVIGMGKLGARELNLSSDIDLIFVYPEAGETDGDKSISNQEFFTRLSQHLIRSLDANTADGFVFRVDMRLRPYGESGALVLNFDAMEEYYQDQGRDWERYAMVKAHVVAGDAEKGRQLLELLRPFTYRRYIDFSAIESLRSMKAMILREVKRKGIDADVKLGSGGIREVEFIAQSFQLIRGGRDVELQERRLLPVLEMLKGNGCLPELAVEELRAAYLFLRDTEHAIQGYQDRQSQLLPGEPHGQERLAFTMGFSGWEAFQETLFMHREAVRGHFANLIEPAESEYQSPVVDRDDWHHFWESELEPETREAALAALTEAGFEEAETTLAALADLKHSPRLRALQQIGRERLDRFMPKLLGAVSGVSKPSLTLLRIMPLVESTLRRSAYLVLLVENPAALSQLVVLCTASPWIARQLSEHPALLDELLDAGSLYHPPQKEALRGELQQQILRLHWDDLEAHMDVLRYFKLAHSLQVAAAEISGTLPLMKVSDYLTWIAEVVLEHVLALAWHQLAAKHGNPQTGNGNGDIPGFIIVGYGKLGGIELGHGSDLDLVFIHDAPSGQSTDGERPLDNSVFFTRLGQRIIHILDTQMALGKLYEVDMRLRPSGASGLLVTSLNAFRDYQINNAWTWEHQALVRARVVAGNPGLATRFNAIRAEILARPRDLETLKKEVVDMREKMRMHLLPAAQHQDDTASFHLKQAYGGIVDIEFMAQYAVLAWAHQYNELTCWTDNIRILESIQQCKLIDDNQAQVLTEAYKAYRAAGHRLMLQDEKGVVEAGIMQDYVKAVLDQWHQYFD